MAQIYLVQKPARQGWQERSKNRPHHPSRACSRRRQKVLQTHRCMHLQSRQFCTCITPSGHPIRHQHNLQGKQSQEKRQRQVLCPLPARCNQPSKQAKKRQLVAPDKGSSSLVDIPHQALFPNRPPRQARANAVSK